MDLNIRSFVPGQDEAMWVDIVNRAHKEDEDFVPVTVEEFRRWRKAPKSTDEGRFVAELAGVPVGAVFADADKQRADKKGSMGRTERRARAPAQGHRNRTLWQSTEQPETERDGDGADVHPGHASEYELR